MKNGQVDSYKCTCGSIARLKCDVRSEEERQQVADQKPMLCSSLLFDQPRAQNQAKLLLVQPRYTHFPLSNGDACG